MIRKLSALTISALLSLSACVAPEGDEQELGAADEPATSETAQSLSVFNWSAPFHFSSVSGVHAQTVTYGTRTIMVATDINGNMSWRERTSASAWTSPLTIAGQKSYSRPSLAAFNGFIYMVRSDSSTYERLWLSRFNLSTATWSSPVLLPYTSYPGPPALAAYKGALHLIGTNKDSHQLWQATMTAAETFSVAIPMAGHYSNSRISAATMNCVLYIAHRGGSTSEVVYNFYNGSAWSYDRTVPAGPGGAPVQAYEPSIAERSNTLHLVYRTPTSDALMWTYLSNGAWPLALSVGTTTTAAGPSLANAPDGLISTILTGDSQQSFRVAALEYSQVYRQPIPCDLPPPIGF